MTSLENVTTEIAHTAEFFNSIYRLSKHWVNKVDYRETLNSQPNFIEGSTNVANSSDSSDFIVTTESNLPSGPLREQRRQQR